MGCMRLSTERPRDEASAVAVVHAALDAGVTLLDSADAYCRDDAETGHNERLLRRAVESWAGDTSRVVVATKGGLTRPGGRWVADGRARHLVAACQASLSALGRRRIALYQLHAPDPRTSLATSVRALALLRRDGLVDAVGLCNVSVRQIEEARGLVEIASVQVELSPFRDDNFRNGVAEHCARHGIRLLAHRPLGGALRRERLENDPLLRALALRHGVSPQAIVLAWLSDLSPVVVPLPGPTRVPTARALAEVPAIRFDDEERARLDERFPAGRLLRQPRAERRPPPGAEGEVVLLMGLPGAGKSTLAAELTERGYERLNRDDRGGRLRDLLPELERLLAAGRRRVVLDNTYGSRASRNAVLETAWGHGVPVRCVWLKTTLEDAQVNAVQRLLSRYGRLLDPDELREAGRDDPGAFAPSVQLRHQRELEPPAPDEGFAAIDEAFFERRRDPGDGGRALLFWYDGAIRTTRSGARRPRDPEDVVVLPGRAALLRRYRDEGWRLLGLSWHPEIAAGTATAAEVESAFARTHALLGVEPELLYCPHAEGPPVCWCRKPLPGLGLVFLGRHRLDVERCLYVGHDAHDAGLARRLGIPYRDAALFFAGG